MLATQQKRLVEILHGGLQFAVGTTELFLQQGRETRIGTVHANLELEILVVCEHRSPYQYGRRSPSAAFVPYREQDEKEMRYSIPWRRYGLR